MGSYVPRKNEDTKMMYNLACSLPWLESQNINAEGSDDKKVELPLPDTITVM